EPAELDAQPRQSAPLRIERPRTVPSRQAALPNSAPVYESQRIDAPRHNDAPQRHDPVPPLGPAREMHPALASAVALKPSATLACPVLSALDRWIANAVQPAANKWFGQPVVEIKQISAYSCRGMNGQKGARISEHAFGNALDIAAFVLADGH